jgi:hypothetical protein
MFVLFKMILPALHFKSADDRPAAIGFALEVDGFRLDLSLPGVDALRASVLPPQLMAASKLNYLYDALRTDPYLPDDLNGFQRDWLFQIIMSALLAHAATTNRTIDAPPRRGSTRGRVSQRDGRSVRRDTARSPGS